MISFKKKKQNKILEKAFNIDEYIIHYITFIANEKEISATIKYSIPKIKIFKTPREFKYNFIRNIENNNRKEKVLALEAALMFKESCYYKYPTSIVYLKLYNEVYQTLLDEGIINKEVANDFIKKESFYGKQY